MLANFKTIVAATAITLGLAMSANANSYIGLTMQMDNDQQITLSNVTADAAGFVAIYEFRLGEIGELLGSAPINEGANSEVIINLDKRPQGDVMAVLYAGDITDPMSSVYRTEVMIDRMQ